MAALAAARGALAAAERHVRDARRPIARLEAEIAGAAAAEAALAELDAADAAAMAAWAETGQGAAPAPAIERRRAAETALAAARARADAARRALPAAQDAADAAARRLGGAQAAIAPAVAAVLRAEGAALCDRYWRGAAEQERLRRELAALDQVLIAAFPIVHAATGRTIVEYLSPDRIAAPAAMRAITAACATLDPPETCQRAWRDRAATLMAG
jgi:hypothetical protein